MEQGEEAVSVDRELLAAVRAAVRAELETPRAPLAVNFEEAARLLSVSPAHVGRMVRRGFLRVSNVAGARRIAMSELQRVLEHPPVNSKPTVRRPSYDAAEASRRLAELRRRR